MKDVKRPLYEKIVRTLERDIAGRITVGIHASEGGEDHGGLTVAELAEIHEFGQGVPARSFIGSWFDSRLDRFPNMIETELLDALRKGKRLTVAFEILAVNFQADVQKRISDGIEPANAESTIRRKGSSKPLIDTGVLRSKVLGVFEK